MKVNFVITIIMTLLVSSCDNTNEADFQEAKQLNKLENYEESNRVLNSLVGKKYKLDSVYFLLGKNYFNIENDKSKFDEEPTDYSHVIEFFDKAILENPQFFAAYKSRIKANHNQGLHKLNLKQINEAIKLFKDSTSLILDRGITKYMLGDYEGGENEINSFLKYENIDTSHLIYAYRFLGLIHHNRFEFHEAVEDFTVAIGLDTVNTDPYLYLNRGDAYQNLGYKKNACQDYSDALNRGLFNVLYYLKEYCN